MHPETWTAVDAHIETTLLAADHADGALDAALRAAEAAGLPPHHVTAPQGKLLHLLARACGARRILEVGTLGGYSTIWLARALPPGGELVTLEVDPAHAAVARASVERADVGAVVEVRVGPALETLPQLRAEGRSPFDLVFLDADKPNTPAYLEWAVRLSRPGTLVVADNVVRGGAVADPGRTDPAAVGVRRALELMGRDARLEATAIQTVGSKGYDGFAVAIVQDVPMSPATTRA